MPTKADTELEMAARGAVAHRGFGAVLSPLTGHWGNLRADLLNIQNEAHHWDRWQGSLLVPDPRPPFDLERIETRDGNFIHEALNRAIPKFGKGVNRWPLDWTYFMVNQDEMARIIGWSWVDRKQYVKERYDCENFAFSFKAEVDKVFLLNQVGLVIDWSGGHGFNLIIFPDGEVWFFEPQNDTRVNIGAGIYKMERADILL